MTAPRVWWHPAIPGRLYVHTDEGRPGDVYVYRPDYARLGATVPGGAIELRPDPGGPPTDADIAHRLADALHAECVARWARLGVGAAVTKHGVDWHAAQVEALVPVVRGLVDRADRDGGAR